jgi:DNA polymerase I-like protein with 3'-5' exonuclease and polymerase domains
VDTSDPDKPRGKDREVQVQNFPRSLRDVVRAEDGCVFLGADWAAIEWCIAMWLAGTPYHLEMLDRFQRQELDPHRLLASVWTGKPETDVSRTERSTAKVGTFGLLYKGGPNSLADRRGVPRKVMQAVDHAHRQAFRLAEWQDEYGAEVNKTHLVETAGGWRRWFWAPTPKLTEVLASQVSGSAADLLKYVMVDIFRCLPPKWEMLTTTHDSLLMTVPEEDAAEAQWWLREKMQQPIPFLGGRGWRAEVKQGRTWKEVS